MDKAILYNYTLKVFSSPRTPCMAEPITPGLASGFRNSGPLLRWLCRDCSDFIVSLKTSLGVLDEN